MLTRRALGAAAPRRLLARAFGSSAAAAQKHATPSLADIAPENQESFNSRQKTFREQLVTAQKEREASAWSQSPLLPL